MQAQAIHEQVLEIIQRLDGAIDTWTVVCLNLDFPSRHEFLSQNSDKLRMAIRALCETAGNNALPDVKQETFAGLSRATDEFCMSFAALEGYPEMSPEELKRVCLDLKSAYEQIRELLHQIHQSSQLVEYEWEETPARRQYFEGILNGLDAQFLQARSKVTTS